MGALWYFIHHYNESLHIYDYLVLKFEPLNLQTSSNH